MANKRLKASEKRVCSINVRFSNEEYKQLKSYLKGKEIKLKSKWIRESILSIISGTK